MPERAGMSVPLPLCFISWDVPPHILYPQPILLCFQKNTQRHLFSAQAYFSHIKKMLDILYEARILVNFQLLGLLLCLIIVIYLVNKHLQILSTYNMLL